LGQGKVKLTAVLINSGGDESLTTTFNTGNSDKIFLIDTILPSLAGATLSASGRDGNAKAGDVITVVVQASEAMALTGINPLQRPSVQISLGGGVTRTAVHNAALSAAAGADKLVFTYTVQDGDSAVAVQPLNSINLNGAVLTDLAGNPSSTAIASVTSSTIRVDTVAPAALTITSVDAAVTGTPGQMVDSNNNPINKINFDEAFSGVKVRVDLRGGSVPNGTYAMAGDTVEPTWRVGTTESQVKKTLQASDVSLESVDLTVPFNTIGVMDGSATLLVRLVDVAGNVSPDSPTSGVD